MIIRTSSGYINPLVYVRDDYNKMRRLLVICLVMNIFAVTQAFMNRHPKLQGYSGVKKNFLDIPYGIGKEEEEVPKPTNELNKEVVEIIPRKLTICSWKFGYYAC